MRQLLFDIGNTRIKWATAQDGALLESGFEVTANINEQLRPPAPVVELLDDPELTVWFCSVGNQDTVRWLQQHWLGKLDAQKIHSAKVESHHGQLQNRYENLDQLGVDRWIAAIGARELQPSGHLIVIDAGTAITIDWIDANHCFQGGVILPGPRLMHDSLVGNTAGIQSEVKPVTQIIGKTTVQCVNSGVTYGLIGAVEKVVDEMRARIDARAIIVGCGGAFHALEGVSFFNEIREQPDLVLRGLLAVAHG